MREKHPAEVGGLDPALVAVEELDAGPALQLLDASCQRRLREVLAARGAGEAAFLGQGAGVTEQAKVEVHAWMLSNP